jgi:hypothetical protein
MNNTREDDMGKSYTPTGGYVAVLNGASQEIGFGVNPEHAVYDLLKEINVVGLDSQQYCWGRA